MNILLEVIPFIWTGKVISAQTEDIQLKTMKELHFFMLDSRKVAKIWSVRLKKEIVSVRLGNGDGTSV